MNFVDQNDPWPVGPVSITFNAEPTIALGVLEVCSYVTSFVAAVLIMMVRLGRRERWRSALLLSILYVLTILSPTLANASGVSPSQHRHEQQMQSHLHNHSSPQTEDHQHHSKHKVPGLVDLQCCGLACISALPAIVAQLLAPAVALGLIQAAEVSEGASRLPPQRYRPPIA